MPINIPDHLPAKSILENENVFVMSDSIAIKQDIRTLKIAILNLMPIKITTELHLLRLLANTPLQIEIDLVITDSYRPKTTPESHLKSFYKTFSQIKSESYDGLIITGAPVEHLNFEDVLYWEEMKEIMQWATANVTSVLYICWAAQAGLYYHYGIKKHPLPHKLFGVFQHEVVGKNLPIVRGFDDVFYAPHSRYTEVKIEDIKNNNQLELACSGEKAGVHLAVDRENLRVFVTGHSEYDPLTLKDEYLRDVEKGLPIHMPENYFLNDNVNNDPIVKWRSHANLLFSNWVNYYVYQQTPFNLNLIKHKIINNNEY